MLLCYFVACFSQFFSVNVIVVVVVVIVVDFVVVVVCRELKPVVIVVHIFKHGSACFNSLVTD